MEFLQEKEVFREFIFRINTLGSAGSCSGSCSAPGHRVWGKRGAPERAPLVLVLERVGHGLLMGGPSESR